VTDQLMTGETLRSDGFCSTAKKPATKSSIDFELSLNRNLTGALESPEGKLAVRSPRPLEALKSSFFVSTPWSIWERPLVTLVFEDVIPLSIWSITQVGKKVCNPTRNHFVAVRPFVIITQGYRLCPMESLAGGSACQTLAEDACVA
jgi:hypothetical protein